MGVPGLGQNVGHTLSYHYASHFSDTQNPKGNYRTMLNLSCYDDRDALWKTFVMPFTRLSQSNSNMPRCGVSQRSISHRNAAWTTH